MFQQHIYWKFNFNKTVNDLVLHYLTSFLPGLFSIPTYPPTFEKEMK